ncbi:unnamed protein product [Ilex paraguariensis]|uniref:Hydroxyproline-rich glycoprotein family protein n=1 Tax=Ilex paraguariensis TaxID=185542 RepID=A0ABC8U0B2_9AQUA
MADNTVSYTPKPQILSSQTKPNQANPTPEFINQTLHTSSWELLQLIFVGIAVSYGLFSKRNDETDKEHGSKLDNAHSFVSRLLQVSSVFDDESENPSGFDDNRVQTWSSQYLRGEPVVVVAQESPFLEEQRSSSSRIGEKPLLLPVRSLKSRVSDSDTSESTNDSSGKSFSLSESSSNSSSRRFSGNSKKSRNGEFGVTSPPDLEENVVLRSPIPWRSRSGRMEMKEDGDNPPLYSLPPSMEDSEFHELRSRSFSSRSSRSSRPNSISGLPNSFSSSPLLSSPKNLSPSSSISSEIQPKNVENLVRKKRILQSSPPPAPPPPTPPFLHKSSLMNSNSSEESDVISSEKELRRSVPTDFNRSNRFEALSRASSGSQSRSRTQINTPLEGKSVRKNKPNEQLESEFGEDFMNGKAERRSKELESNSFHKRGYSDRLMQEYIPAVLHQSYMELPKAEKKQFIEKVMVETDDGDSLSEDEYFEGSLDSEEVTSNSVDSEEVASNSVGDGGPDVDKKADEFIAKFREQIRLQRIESIRRSTGHHSKNSLR